MANLDIKRGDQSFIERFINTSAQNVLIQDTGNQVLSGAITLNQYDSLMLWFDGTRWIQLATSNN